MNRFNRILSSSLFRVGAVLCLGISCILWFVTTRGMGTAGEARAPLQKRPRLAILPLMYDMELENDVRQAAGGFDARLQAELLTLWDVELVSRTHLGTVAFEKKLRIAEDADGESILPAEAVVVPVLDSVARQLRLYVVPVREGMTVPQPRLLRIINSRDLNGSLVSEAAKLVAMDARLALHSGAVTPVGELDRPLTCALLPPVCHDNVRQAAESQSPMIHAAIEQSLTSFETGKVTLVDRTHLAALLDEKMRSELSQEWSPNAAARIGLMAKADLLLIPCVHALNPRTVRTDLFAVEVRGGRIVACATWEGVADAPPPLEKVTSVLKEGIAHHGSDSPLSAVQRREMRHAEATFLPDMVNDVGHMRVSAASMQGVSLRVADAVVGLCADDEALMGKLLDEFWERTIPNYLYALQPKYNPFDQQGGYLAERVRLKKSGLLSRMQAEARQVLERPLTELAKTGGDGDKSRLAQFYLKLDEPEKALSLLMEGISSLEELAKNDGRYAAAATALLDLGRYQECADLVFSREKPSPYAWERGVIAYRELGDKEREFEALWQWRTYQPSSADFLVRRLELAVELGRAAQMVDYITGSWNYGATNTTPVRLAIVKARLAAGQTEYAISDAQCALICERIDNKNQTAITDLEAMLAKENVAPLDRLPLPREFIKVPGTWCIQLAHDQSIKPAHARAVAELLADAWGCTVKVWGLKIDTPRLSFYDRFKDTVDADGMTRLLARADLPADPHLAFVYLTRLKSTLTSNSSFINVAKHRTRSMDYVSDYYVLVYNPQLSVIQTDAALCSGLVTISQFLNEEIWRPTHSGASYETFDPDALAIFQNFNFSRRSLGVSPLTGRLLAQIKPEALRAYVDEETVRARRRGARGTNDKSVVQDISNQFATLRPVIVTYPLQPSSTSLSTKP